MTRLVDSLGKVLAVGDIRWARDQAGAIASLAYSCPCGCGVLRSLPVRAGQNMLGKYWGWNGDLNAATLYPSIRIWGRLTDGLLDMDAVHWHGWLKNGEFIQS